MSAGILQMLVSAPSHMLQNHWEAILHTLQWLVDIQDQDTGNWSHKASRNLLTEASIGHSHRLSDGRADNTDNDAMVQCVPLLLSLSLSCTKYRGNTDLIRWCHGAPGVLILFSKLLRRKDTPGLTLPESLCDGMRDALARGAELVYECGLLRKGVGLCHGVAGSVYTLLAVSDILDLPPPESHPTQSQASPPIRITRSNAHRQEPGNFEMQNMYWFSRAFHLAHLATSYRRLTQRGEMRSPDRPVSLYEGLAGMCCAWAEVLKRLDELSALARSTTVVDGGEQASHVSGRRGMPGYDDLP